MYLVSASPLNLESSYSTPGTEIIGKYYVRSKNENVESFAALQYWDSIEEERFDSFFISQ